MIKKLLRQMLIAQILSALTVSLCLLIDSIMIGRYLGDGGHTAYILANPVLLVIGAVGSMLSAGVQVACSKSLGRGSQEETNVGYSSAIAVAAVFSIAFTLLVILLRVPLARLMGASDEALLKDTSGYMLGFVIGAPATMGALILVPFLQIVGQSGLLVAAVLGMTVTDVAFDLLNVLVFHGGMFGMGLASSLSYYVAVLIGGGYFLSKKCVFKFSRDRVKWSKVRELIVGGVPTVFGMASSVVMIFGMNNMLMAAGGAAAVAAFAVVNTVGNASNCISTGSAGVGLTLSGIFFNEEDRSALREMLRLLARYSFELGVGMAALLLVCAPPIVRLFIPEAGESQRLAILGVRVYAFGLIPNCFNYALKNCYQGIGRVRLMAVITILENAVLPTLAAFVLIRLAGVDAAWFFYIIAETLILVGVFLYVWRLRGGFTLRAEDVLLLPDGFGVPPEDMLEADIRDMDGVMAVSRAADAFCRAHGHDARLANHLALCVEEMGSNIVAHGFGPKGKNHLSVRLQYKDAKWTLRFRDDCRAFDPVSHIAGPDAKDSVGIHLAMRIADEARYTYSMNLNNLTLVLEDTTR